MFGFGKDRQNTKKSCMGNAIVAFLLGIIMVICIFIKDPITPEEIKGFLISAGIMAVVGLYWLFRWHRFDDPDINDPFHWNH